MSLPAEYFAQEPISPLLEMGAYEFLWLQSKVNFRQIAEQFRRYPGSIPSDFVEQQNARRTANEVLSVIRESGIGSFGVRIHGASQYPSKLRDAIDPVELLYFQGFWELTESPKAIAVVGSRKPSPEGIASTRELVQRLVCHGYTIVSGLAAGIDTVAHETAIKSGGKTISVIGTPITDNYPKENRALQRLIAEEHLLISQVPILRYRKQDWRANRLFFPERNKTMSALTQATIIMEAGETSGTLIQARAALDQGRKLFILDRCFRNPKITWPHKYEAQGAIRVHDLDDIKWGLDGV